MSARPPRAGSLDAMLIPLVARFLAVAVAAIFGLTSTSSARSPGPTRLTPAPGAAVSSTARSVVVRTQPAGTTGVADGHRVAVRPTVFVTPGGDDRGRCTRARPCRSLDRAYRVAPPGAAVSVKAGTYPDQQIRAQSGRRAGAPVVFLAAGARFGEIRIEGRDLELRNLVADGWLVRRGAADVTLRNVRSSSTVFITSASNVRVIGGVIDGRGRYWSNGNQIKTASSSAPEPRGILFDHVTIRNFRRRPGSHDHVDCLHVMSGNGIVIRNSYFRNCEAFDVLFTVFLGTTPRRIRIENNEFHCCGSGFYAVLLGGGHGERFDDVVIRSNSSDKSFSVGTVNQISHVTFSNNVVPGIGGCTRSGVRSDHNLLYSTRNRCGRTNLRAAPGFVSATNLHLRARSAAINRGGRNAPVRDRDGRRRGRRPDIGAYERR